MVPGFWAGSCPRCRNEFETSVRIERAVEEVFELRLRSPQLPALELGG
jgi:hypothetical protein